MAWPHTSFLLLLIDFIIFSFKKSSMPDNMINSVAMQILGDQKKLHLFYLTGLTPQYKYTVLHWGAFGGTGVLFWGHLGSQKKKFWTDYENFFTAVFSCFQGQNFFNLFQKYCSILTKSCIKCTLNRLILKLLNLRALKKGLLMQDWIFRLGLTRYS